MTAPPPNRNSDVLAKALHAELQARLDNSTLRVIEAYAFLNSDHPNTTDAVTMAQKALLYLGTDADGNWRNGKDVAIACLSFLYKEIGCLPTKQQAEELMTHMKNNSQRNDTIRNWFTKIYT